MGVSDLKLCIACIAAVSAVVIGFVCKPMRRILVFLLNAASLTAVMLGVNAAFPHIAVGINPFTVFVSGLLGLPGTATVYILKNLIC